MTDAPRTITHAEYLQLQGLASLARHHQKQADQFADAIAKLLGVEPVGGDDLGIYDVVSGYEDRGVDWLLEGANITVEPPPEKAEKVDPDARLQELLGEAATLAREQGYDVMADGIVAAARAEALR